MKLLRRPVNPLLGFFLIFPGVPVFVFLLAWVAGRQGDRTNLRVEFYTPSGQVETQTFRYQGAPYLSNAGGLVIPSHQAAYAPGVWIRWELTRRVEVEEEE